MVKLWGEGCGCEGVWPQGGVTWPAGKGTKNLKIHVVHQNGRNLKCSSIGCVVRLWGEGCGCEGGIQNVK